MRLVLPLAAAVALATLPRAAAGQGASSQAIAVSAVVRPATSLAVTSIASAAVGTGAAAGGLAWRLPAGERNQQVLATVDGELPPGVVLVVDRRATSGTVALRVAPAVRALSLTRTVTLTVMTLN